MSGLRLDIDLGKVHENATELVRRCAGRGMTVTAVTKVALGDPRLASSLGAAAGLGDSRIENIERMRAAGSSGPMLLLRTPSPNQADRVVASGAMSVNTEGATLAALAGAARSQGRVHDVMLMVELGDLREGLMPARIDGIVRLVLDLPDLRLRGLGANLACRNGIEPSAANMGELSAIVDEVEARFGIEIETVSGGNSANLDWAFGPDDPGRINDLRLGESILLGTEPLRRRPIEGLHLDAFTLTAEVIESQCKPSKPWGTAGQNAFAETPTVTDRGEVWQTIFAAGRQDIDPSDLRAPDGLEILSASSDHLVTATDRRMEPGESVRFVPGYSALLRAMTSPFVVKDFAPDGLN